jgi:Arylsulfatase A and related enzymes
MKNKKPNIVFLFPDQFRSDFIESNGADWLETPNINSIAKNGINYKNAFSASLGMCTCKDVLVTG